MSKVCYVCCVYFGDRRCQVDEFEKDPLVYFREHVRSLFSLQHNLDKILFVVNLEEEHRAIFERAREIAPSQIQGAQVELVERENIGMSYGAWSYAYQKYRGDYDYYIFTEDDYYFNVSNFDSYLVHKFRSLKNVGYLAALAMNPTYGHNWGGMAKVHAGNSVGISSSEVLEQLFQKFGMLPHSTEEIEDLEERYGTVEQLGQVDQTHEIYKLGYNILDVREDFAVPHYMGGYLKHRLPEFDHFVDLYFHWNKEALIVPAFMKFNYKCFFIWVADPQYQKKRSCLVVNFYLGDRRKTVPQFYQDRLCFLRKQIETLEKYDHNLQKIVFCFNLEKEHYSYLTEIVKITPPKLQNAEVDIVVRENLGMSYASFSHCFGKYREDYDYFFFNEDDYFLVEKSWDEYMIRSFNYYPETGYYCAIQADEESWNGYRIHASHCFGVSSTSVLNQVWEENGGKLPHSLTNDYVDQENAQRDFSHSVVKLGKRIYDVREDYRVAFGWTAEEYDVHYRFWWNEKDLIIPAVMAFEQQYSWYQPLDQHLVRKTNMEKYND